MARRPRDVVSWLSTATLCLYVAWLTLSFNAHVPAVASSLERLGVAVSGSTSVVLAFSGMPSVAVAAVLMLLLLTKELLVNDRLANLWLTLIVFMAVTWCWQLAIADLYRPFRDVVLSLEPGLG